MPPLKCRALQESAMTNAICRSWHTTITLIAVFCAEPQYAVPPWVRIYFVSKLFAGRAIDCNHLINFALHLGRSFSRGCAASQDRCYD